MAKKLQVIDKKAHIVISGYNEYYDDITRLIIAHNFIMYFVLNTFIGVGISDAN
jgi:hypothetical protein